MAYPKIVEFLGPYATKEVSEFQIQEALKLLKVGARYKVNNVYQDENGWWAPCFYLEEFPHKSFNANLFKGITPTKKVVDTK